MGIFRKAQPTQPLTTLAPEVEIIVVGDEYYTGMANVREGAVTGVNVSPDAKNTHDKNAVAVHVDGVLTGYLSAARAERYRPIVTATMAVEAHARPAGPCLALFVMLPRPRR
jgi:hypothetical protein